MPAPKIPNGLPEIISTFGNLVPYIQDDGTLATKWEVDQMTRINLPFSIPFCGHPTVMITKMECHHLLADVFLQTFKDIAAKGLKDKITSYGGCYAARAKRTSTHWSAHAWGIAVDLCSETCCQGTKGDMHPAVIQVFKDHGFTWGGAFSGKSIDPMHFQYCSGY